jgi:uncharacterized protein YcsI (UPF0317 family)
LAGSELESQRVRAEIRAGRITGTSRGMAMGFVQCNLVILPKQHLADFLLYCERNARACPVLEVGAPGDPVPHRLAPGADLRTDVPGYRVFRPGHDPEDRDDLLDLWSDDRAAFLLGCSHTFEHALARAGFALPHLGTGRAVAMYRTSIPVNPAGPFEGPMVVSMRWIAEDRVAEAAAISGRYPNAHGAPVHIGDPDAIGIRDLARPDYGDAWTGVSGEVPVFWACGVTPQAIAVDAGIDFMITHTPGRMFVTDLPEWAT